MLRLVCLPLIALSFLLSAHGTVFAQAPEIEYRANVEYGKAGDVPLTLHLALPTTGENRPVVVYIHGGGWAAGTKDSHVAAIKQAAAAGYVAVSVGYRFAPKNPFPAQVEDVKCAVRYLRAHADELKLDKNRIGAIGFSAGAHLVMMLGTMDKGDGLEGDGGWPEESSKVQAVVAYFGPTNLLSEYPETSRNILKGFIGGTQEEKQEQYRLASPITYVNEGDAPMLLFQGTDDVLVPFDQAFQMATALTKAKVPGRVEIMLNHKHGWSGPEFERTQRVSHEFFKEQLLAK